MAETLLWYRFGGAGNVITNVASPGVMDGTLKSIESWGWNNSGNDETKFPVRTSAFPNGVRVIDPQTDAISAGGMALSWTGDKDHTGAVVVPAADLTAAFKSMREFTVEAFFKMSQAAIDRVADGGNAMFPIVHWGNDMKEGMMFGMYYSKNDSDNEHYLAPFARVMYDINEDGTSTGTPSCNANWSIRPLELDVWHHVALVVTVSGEGASASMSIRLYLDYQNIGTATPQNHGYYGVHLLENSNPLMIGANIFNSGRSFLGEIAEVRISNAALSNDEMLRPLPPGPVDGDTLVYLPLGDTPCFSSFTVKSGKMNVPFNAAMTARYNPIGWKTAGAEANIGCGVPAVADESYGAAVRGGCLDTNPVPDVGSLTFSSEPPVTVSGLIGHVLEFPKDDLATLYSGDFTFEWFFKTSYAGSQAMIVSPWTKVMVHNGKVLARIGDYNNGGQSGSVVVNDGAWHHCALVYRHGVNAFECWVDYKLDVFRVADALASNTMGFYFGGQGYNAQVFNGQLDDLRITKRALAPHEFLTARPVAAGANATDVFHAPLEGSVVSGQDEFFVSNGVVRAAGSDAAASAAFADVSRDYDLDNDGVADVTSSKSLSLDGTAYLDFPASLAFQTRDFTLEFFAKISGAGNGAHLVRIVKAGAYGNASAMTVLASGGISANVSANGSSSGAADRTIAAPGEFGLADGRWHHWAITVSADYTAATTTVRVYRDCEEVQGYGGTVQGLCAFPTGSRYSLMFGYSNEADGALTGQFDEIRLRPGVQPMDTFMRQILPKGLNIVIR